jgi:arginyl-tRNA synthetase
MLFDIDLAKQKTNENPVFYVQYAHARISNIFKNAAEKNILFEEISTIKNLNSEEEKNLIKEIDRFEEILDSILIDYKINKLTNYLESLASFFHSFYSKHIIVDENDIKTTKERLALCRAVQNTLKGGLSLLGVSAPENM